MAALEVEPSAASDATKEPRRRPTPFGADHDDRRTNALRESFRRLRSHLSIIGIECNEHQEGDDEHVFFELGLFIGS